MQLSTLFPLMFLSLTGAHSNASSNCQCTTSSFPVPFSSSFQQPEPPNLVTEFTAHWTQHKWNLNLSHISAGFLYNSPSNSKVRADEAFDRTFGTSIFDYKNTTKGGLVNNILITYSPSFAAKPSVFEDYVNSDFPLFEADILKANQAVFSGLTDRPYNGLTATWNILYQGAIPVTLYIDCCNVLIGYDYFAPGLRTRVTTDYFDVTPGLISSDIFTIPK